MALWAGTSINTNILGATHDRVLNRKATNFAKTRYALAARLFGKEVPGVGNAAPTFEKVRGCTGTKDKIRLIGALPTIPYVANGSAEVAASTINYDADLGGGFEFDLASFAYTYGIPSSEFEKIRGKEAETENWMDEVIENYLMPGYHAKINSELNANTAAPSDTELTSMLYIIATDNTYGLDRTDNANAAFQGNVYTSTGTLSLTNLNSDKNIIAAKGGDASFANAETSVYGIVENLLLPYGFVTYTEDKARLGYKNMSYAQVEWALDPDVPSGSYFMIDERVWGISMSNGGVRTVIDDKPLYAANAEMVLRTSLRMQLWCKNPKLNVRRTGITG